MDFWHWLGGGVALLLAAITAFGLFGGMLSRAWPDYSTRPEDEAAARTNERESS